jgi:transketolase
MQEILRRGRLRLLEMHHAAGVGHIGGNLSSLDVMLTLHHRVLGLDDRFVLSKGHAAGALYVTLWSKGVLTDADLARFHKDGTKLSGHPPALGIPGVAFATGSLGHGLGLAAGLALGKKLKGEAGRVFCLTSDGEWNEGSTWEALIFSKHQQLSNLTIIIDLNGLQGMGTTRDVADLGSLAEKLGVFGFTVLEIDGHDPAAIEAALATGSGPLAIVARTIKGRGVSFMENRVEWHYLPMTAEQYQQAIAELAQSGLPDGGNEGSPR